MTTWIVLTCMSGREIQCRNEMQIDLDLEAMVPNEPRLRKWRSPDDDEPYEPRALMPGYLFVGLNSWSDWSQIRRVKGVRIPLRADGRFAQLTPSEVAALSVMSRAPHETLAQRSAAYKIGDRIKIKRGALAELEAVVAGLTGGQIEVSTMLLGKEHRVKVDAQHVEAA